MTLSEFKKAVEEFASWIDYGALAEVKVSGDDEPSGEIVVVWRGNQVCRSRTWTIPVGLDENGEVAICLGDDNYFPLDTEHLYTYLFFEAEVRLNKLEINRSEEVASNGR